MPSSRKNHSIKWLLWNVLWRRWQNSTHLLEYDNKLRYDRFAVALVNEGSDIEQRLTWGSDIVQTGGQSKDHLLLKTAYSTLHRGCYILHFIGSVFSPDDDENLRRPGRGETMKAKRRTCCIDRRCIFPAMPRLNCDVTNTNTLGRSYAPPICSPLQLWFP